MSPLRGNESNLVAESFEVNATNSTPFDFVTEQLVNILNIYYTPLLVALGSIGNILCIVVFYTSKLRLQSTSQYLSVLALSDTAFLCQLLPPWLNAVQITSLFHRKGFCQVFVYISYVTCCLSAWLVVAFTVERFVAVLHPLRRNAVCTVKRARHIICTLVVAALVLNLPVVRFAVPSKNDCNVDFEYLEQAARFNLVDTAISFTAPLVVIIILNAWIMVGVYRLEHARHQLMKVEEERAPRGGLPRAVRPVGCPRSQQRVTRMLLIVSTVFVVLNLPAYTMRILAYTYELGEREHTRRWAALQHVSLLFFNTNFGINFILYCLSGQNFRHALVQLIPGLRRRPWRGLAMRTVTSFRPGHTSSASTSFVSNCTEVSSNNGHNVATVSVTPSRSCRNEHTIQRWTFDNSRLHRAVSSQPQEGIEMQVFSSSSTVVGPRSRTSRQGSPRPVSVRTIPYNLFPYRYLITGRKPPYRSDITDVLFN